MMMDTTLAMRLTPIGHVASSLKDVRTAPKMEDEGGVTARLVIEPAFRPAMLGLAAGQELIVMTWLHLADRSYLQVHPRGDARRPLAGVFNTRSPDRPNPVGLHQVRVVALHADGLEVAPLEAVDGTPLLDIKPLRWTLPDLPDSPDCPDCPDCPERA